MLPRRVLGAGTLALVVATPLSAAAAADAGVTTRINVARTTGADTHGSASRAVVSSNGVFVAFESNAHDIVPGDTRTKGWDVYYADRRDPAATIVKVSSGFGGAAPNGNSHLPSLSADGRYVVFSSDATNLVAGSPTRGLGNIYRRDMTTGTTSLVTTTVDGGAPAPGYSARPTISNDGNLVQFYSQACNLVASVCPAANVGNIYVKNMTTGMTRAITRSTTGGEPNGDSVRAELSGNGAYVVLESGASNLVAGDTNGVIDIFRIPVATAQAVRVSVDTAGGNPDGASGRPTTDDTGRYVAYESWAGDLVAGDTNGKLDAFVRDTATGGSTVRVSLSAKGAQLNNPSSRPALSGDGRLVAFVAGAGSVDPPDHNGARDVFVRNWRDPAPSNLRVSAAQGGADGGCATGASVADIATRPALSQNGSVITFVSEFCNLTPGDANGANDVFGRVWPAPPL